MHLELVVHTIAYKEQEPDITGDGGMEECGGMLSPPDTPARSGRRGRGEEALRTPRSAQPLAQEAHPLGAALLT